LSATIKAPTNKTTLIKDQRTETLNRNVPNEVPRTNGAPKINGISSEHSKMSGTSKTTGQSKELKIPFLNTLDLKLDSMNGKRLVFL
jgi:hypothetical protein